MRMTKKILITMDRKKRGHRRRENAFVAYRGVNAALETVIHK